MAAIVQRSEYDAYVRFTLACRTYRFCTQDSLRDDGWYDGVLVAAPQLAMTFGDDLSLVQANDVEVAIAAPAASALRAALTANAVEGMAARVTLVMRQFWSDGATTEQVYEQQLTVIGKTLLPAQVTLALQDMEAQALQVLYPPDTWQPADWPDISSDDAGKPICEPVGTALKFPAVSLIRDNVNGEYWYGVCTGTPKLIGITSITSGTKTIVLDDDPPEALVAGDVIIVTGSTAADGRYTVASNAGASIVVVETLPAATGGSVRLLPQVLTVYRNKRIVSAVEYEVHQCYAPAVIVNGDFAAGFANWQKWWFTTGSGFVNAAPGGSGSSLTTGAGGLTITSVDSTDYAFIRKRFGDDGGAEIAGAYYAVLVTVGAGGAARVFSAPGATGRICSPNRTTAVLLQSNGTGANTGQRYFDIHVDNDDGTAVITRVRIVPLNLTLLRFTLPQIDFNNSPYAIEADCRGVESRIASDEISRLLGKAGATADAASFAAAASADFSQYVDCDHGRGGQRRIDAILNDLLLIARGGLSRNADGAYTIWQDAAGAPALSLDESEGDRLDAKQLRTTSQPVRISLSYSPGSDSPDTMTQKLERDVPGGILGAEEPRVIRYLRDGTTADEWLCYRALRRQRNGKLQATIYSKQIDIGTIVELDCPKLWPDGARLFTAWTVQRVPSGNQMTLLEYDEAVYVYTPSASLPPEAGTGYEPDYSQTPPAAPTDVAITDNQTQTLADGSERAYVIVQATPPAVNWARLIFAAIDNITGEIVQAPGGPIGGGLYGVTVGPLNTGVAYRLNVYAINATNVSGEVADTFDATAIGGGATDSTFDSSGIPTPPGNVTSCTATLAGTNINVTWPTVAGAVAYVLERTPNYAGQGVFGQVYSGGSASYTDTFFNLGPNHNYQYRVKAQDVHGTLSATWTASNVVFR